jgi:hypothetical protein
MSENRERLKHKAFVQVKVLVQGLKQQSLDLFLDEEMVEGQVALQMRKEYRCTSSELIMQNPVLSYDGCFYERQVYERLIRQGHVDPKYAQEGGAGFIEATQLRNEIQAFIREELEKLKVKKLTQTELKTAAEYLTALLEEDPNIKAAFLSSALTSDELDFLLTFIQAHSGLSPQLKAKLKEDCPLAAIRLFRCLMQSEPSELLTAEFIEYAGKCPPLPELFEVASELVLSLSKAQQLLLIESLETRQDLKIKEKESVTWLKLKASLYRGDSDPRESGMLRPSLERGDLESRLHSEVSSAAFEAFAREMRQANETLSREVQERLSDNSAVLEAFKKEIRELRQAQTDLQREDKNPIKADSLALLSEVREMKRSQAQLNGEMQDFKLHYQRTEETIKTDINHIQDYLRRTEEVLLETRLNTSLDDLFTTLTDLTPQVAVPPPTPHKIFSYKTNSSSLYWTDLETGEQGTQALPSYTFQQSPSLCEGPDNQLFITGGWKGTGSTEVVSVQMDSLALNKSHAAMLTGRVYHGSAYFDGYLYVLSGAKTKLCERYNLQQNTWTAIAPFPTSSTCDYQFGVAVLESGRKLFTFGG